MNLLLRQFGRLRLAALIITSLPLLALPLLGALWLWQHGDLLLWLLALLLAGALGFSLHALANRRERDSLEPFNTRANPNWHQQASDPWTEIEHFAAQLDAQHYPLSDGGQLFELGKQTLSRVASHYHPGRREPLLELTVPHTLLIIERASRELREQITAHIPLSHRFTLGDISRAKRWKEVAGQFENVYRLGYAVVDPSSVIFREFRREIGSRITGYGSAKVQNWLVQEYVRKVGYYAIELYSGQTLLSADDPTDSLSKASRKDQQRANEQQQELDREPLRFLVLGRTNAGKSSLINALFGTLTSAADIVPDTTTELLPFQLERPGEDGNPETAALIFDSPGFDAGLLTGKAMKRAVQQADLILLVTPATQADREQEHAQLSQIRQWQQAQQRPAPVLLVVSHIDRLRPLREWQPPYNLDTPDSAKARNIQAASQAAAEQLGIAISDTVPVCLAEGQHYNVDDTLWAAILARQSDAERNRYLRCLGEKRQQENWSLLWQQLANSGRLLVKKAVSR